MRSGLARGAGARCGVPARHGRTATCSPRSRLPRRRPAGTVRTARFPSSLILRPSPLRGSPSSASCSTGPRPAAATCTPPGWLEFLGRAGYDVRHVFARFAAWGIGRVADASADHERSASNSTPADWNVAAIQARFRRAVEAFRPDYVVITDAWNMKPLLAEAMRGLSLLPRLPGARRTSARSITSGCWRRGRTASSNAPAISSPRRRSAIAASPSAGITPGRCTRPSGLWPASARRNMTRSCAGRSRRPRPCWRSTR